MQVRLNNKDVSPKRQPRDGSDALTGSVGKSRSNSLRLDRLACGVYLYTMKNAELMDAIEKAEWERSKRIMAECRRVQQRIRNRLFMRAKRAKEPQ